MKHIVFVKLIFVYLMHVQHVIKVITKTFFTMTL